MSKVPCTQCGQAALNAKAYIQQQRTNNAPTPLRASSAGLEVLTGKKTQAALETTNAEAYKVETHKDVSTPEEQPQPEAVAVEEIEAVAVEEIEAVAVEEIEAVAVEKAVPTQPKRSPRTKASVTTTVES